AAVAVQRVVDLLVEHGGGAPDAGVTDVDERLPVPPLRLPVDLAATVVGVPYTRGEVIETLRTIGCAVQEANEVLTVHPPSWRPDLDLPVTLVEEVARLRGYEQIVPALPIAPAGRGLTAHQRAR